MKPPSDGQSSSSSKEKREAQITEGQKYLSAKLDPIILPMVTHLVANRPDDPIPYMIDYLTEQQHKAAPGAITRLNSEIGHLKLHIHKLEEKYGKLEETVADSSDEDEDDDDDDEEGGGDGVGDLWEPELTPVSLRPRNSVSAEAYGEWNKKKDSYTPPVYPKTEDQKTRLRKVLLQSFLFQSLEEKDFNTVIDAMQEKVLEESTRIIQQGDDGDILYVVESGELECYKKFSGEAKEKLVKTCREGDAFGELALLYNCSRAASVQSKAGAVLWQLDRETFNHIVKDAAAKKRAMYESFLKSVPLLEAMDPYERSKVADALKTEVFQDGEYILRQGDNGDKFYFIESGKSVASKSYVSGQLPQEVKNYKVGDYFGELALLNNEPRAANVIAKGTVQVACLDRRSFKRLLGPLQDILTRNISQYE